MCTSRIRQPIRSLPLLWPARPPSPPYTLNFIGLNAPAGLAIDANGNLYVADSGNKQVLVSNRQNPLISFGTVPQGQPTAAQPLCPNTLVSNGLNIGTTTGTGGCVLTVTNVGNQPVALTNPFTSITNVSPAGNTAFNVSSNCVSPMPAGASCTVSATFQPTADGPQSENINLNGGSNSVALMASTNAVGAQPLVNIVLSSSAGLTPAANSTPTITATVTQPHIPGNTPSGTVTFTYVIDANTYQAGKCGSGGAATVALNGSGIATFTMPSLGSGLSYTVSANYNGDSQNSPTQAAPIVLAVPGIQETVTANSVSYTYGSAVPTLIGTITPAPASGVTTIFTSGASQFSAVGIYPIQIQFQGTNACAYGFPTVSNSGAGGGPATVTENPAALNVVVPAYTTVYGAAPFNFASGLKITGAVGNDLAKFSETFTPADSSVLDVKPALPAVNPYPGVATLTGSVAGNYTIKYTNGTDTVTAAPSGVTVTASATSILTGTQNTVTYALLASTLVPAGKGVPSGSVAVTDSFVPIDPAVFGPPCNPNLTVNCNNAVSVPACSSTVTSNCIPPCTSSVTTNCSPLPLTAGAASFSLPSTFTALGTHNFTFTYSGDAGSNGDGKADFQCSVAGGPATSSCPTTAAAPYSLIVDNKDFNVTTNAGALTIVPGVIPSGLGLPTLPNQNSSYPETAAITVNPVLGFTGTVAMSCTTQNPSYVSCAMTPISMCFGTGTGCFTSGSGTSILQVSTPATLPLGFFGTTTKAQLRTSATRTVLAFLPLGVLAFCMRRRRRLSQALWMLMILSAVSAGISGCGGGNQVDFYTPVPTGPQTVTVTATSGGVARSFAVPINID